MDNDPIDERRKLALVPGVRETVELAIGLVLALGLIVGAIWLAIGN